MNVKSWRESYPDVHGGYKQAPFHPFRLTSCRSMTANQTEHDRPMAVESVSVKVSRADDTGDE